MPEDHEEQGRGLAELAHKADPFPFYVRPRAEAPVDRVTLPDE